MSEGGWRTASNAAQATARRAWRGWPSRFGAGPCGPPPEACADARPDASEAAFTASLARWPATWLTVRRPPASPAARACGAVRRSGVTPLHDGVEPDALWTGKDAAAIRLAHAAGCPRRPCHGRCRHAARLLPLAPTPRRLRSTAPTDGPNAHLPIAAARPAAPPPATKAPTVVPPSRPPIAVPFRKPGGRRVVCSLHDIAAIHVHVEATPQAPQAPPPTQRKPAYGHKGLLQAT